jgi:hypothetical protein
VGARQSGPSNAALVLPFRIRGVDGSVRVSYSRNEDPRRWGYDLLGLDFDIEMARGFPIIEASVEWPLEGYAAKMGWIQVVRYSVGDQADATVIVDVAPQLKDSGVPFIAFGVRPTTFDAPATTEANVMWRAVTFLTYGPNAHMTRTVKPAVGLRWGYDVRDGVCHPVAVKVASGGDWNDARDELRKRYPEWTFLK